MCVLLIFGHKFAKNENLIVEVEKFSVNIQIQIKLSGREKKFCIVISVKIIYIRTQNRLFFMINCVYYFFVGIILLSAFVVSYVMYINNEKMGMLNR